MTIPGMGTALSTGLYLGRYSHGYSAYRRGCRCDECRYVIAAQKRASRGGGGPGIKKGLQQHGISGYKRHMCRCDICRAANTAQKRRSRAKAKSIAMKGERKC